MKNLVNMLADDREKYLITADEEQEMLEMMDVLYKDSLKTRDESTVDENVFGEF